LFEKGKLTPLPLNSAPRVKNSKPAGAVIPHAATWRQRAAAVLVYGLIRFLAATLRTEFEDRSGVFHEGRQQAVIFCIWHNRLALSLMIGRLFVQKFPPPRRLAAMVSASRDGAFFARILELFDAEPVRGSTSRRGPQALRELTAYAERGYDLAITPDGPRGPRYVVQEGVIALAQLTGLCIVPVSYHLSWKLRANSWDRFQVPLPFARWTTVLGPPLRVPREASAEDREKLRLDLERELRAITTD
jgi:lysophospholipid acyltransferase (LPLAT)-like uncharacterized protein